MRTPSTSIKRSLIRAAFWVNITGVEILDEIRRAIPRYNMLAAGDRVTVAVSGGADSVALLEAMHLLAPEFGITLEVAHVNHRLRGAESEADAAFVAGLAAAHDLRCHVMEAPVTAGSNVEEAAREARLACFRTLGGRVATGHTRDDQAETVLLRLLRGAGAAGLAGVLPVTREGLIRPLLEVPREALRGWARDRGLAWREDATNALGVFARNRIRAQLLPELERDWNPAVREVLARTAAVSRADEAFLAAETARRWRTVREPGGTGACVLRVPALLAEPEAMKTRIVRRAIEAVRGDLRRIGFEHVDRILALAAAAQGDGRLQVPGVDVFRSFEWLRFAAWPPADTGRNWSVPITGPGEYPIPGTDLVLVVSDGVYNGDTVRIGWSGAGRSDLILRNWRPGDAYQRPGQEAEEKIKLLFQQARIPLWERRNWPIITRKETIVWSKHFGVSSACAALEAGAPSLGVRCERRWSGPDEDGS